MATQRKDWTDIPEVRDAIVLRIAQLVQSDHSDEKLGRLLARFKVWEKEKREANARRRAGVIRG